MVMSDAGQCMALVRQGSAVGVYYIPVLPVMHDRITARKLGESVIADWPKIGFI